MLYAKIYVSHSKNITLRGRIERLISLDIWLYK